ncbi:SDR family oxidoreductase [Pseudomonas piscis]|uniref:SDR family oxidoreductase n=1 Tax=Pseudomonas piscis TaxID=2614538 RepID=UPI0021D59F98|nr:SDR family oxidoreductase [Pseudomonas piscis]
MPGAVGQRSLRADARDEHSHPGRRRRAGPSFAVADARRARRPGAAFLARAFRWRLGKCSRADGDLPGRSTAGTVTDSAGAGGRGAGTARAGRYAAGYAASKWAGEVLLQEAWEKWAIPVKVFRCGMLLPHSTHPGFVNFADIFSRFLVSLVQTAIAPPSFHLDSSRSKTSIFRGLPVDAAARSIAQISLGVEAGYSIYHVQSNGPDAPSLDLLVEWIRELGYPLEKLGSTEAWSQEFMARLQALDARPRSYSLYSSVYQLDELQEVLNQPEFDSHRFAERTRSLIDGAVAQDWLAPIDRKFISGYLTELANAGLI